MAINKLSSPTISKYKLKEGSLEKILSDGDGLYLRIRPGELKSWFFWYTAPLVGKNGKKRRPKLFIGDYPTITLEVAREKADGYRRIVASGKDPKHELEQAALAEVLDEETPSTVEELFNTWKKHELAGHSDGGKYAGGFIERYVLPALGRLELDRLRQPQIATVLAAVKVTGKANTTGRVLGYLRQMFGYSVERGWLAGDPTAGMRKVKWTGPRVKRTRVLRRGEITKLAQLCATAELPPLIECAVWVMLACGTRVEETGLAQLKHIDFKNGTWFIPAANQKKTGSPSRDHCVELSAFALKWFKRLTELQNERAINANNRLAADKRLAAVPKIEVNWLWPAQKRLGPINHKTIAHCLNDRQRPGQEPIRGRTQLVDAMVLAGGKWTPHDLRRTASTLMRELKTPSDVVERCLNHVSADDLVATYQLSELQDEMQAGWFKLGELLETLVTRQPSDVRYAAPVDDLSEVLDEELDDVPVYALAELDADEAEAAASEEVEEEDI